MAKVSIHDRPMAKLKNVHADKTVVSSTTGRRGTVQRVVPPDGVWVRWDNDDEFLYMMLQRELRAVD